MTPKRQKIFSKIIRNLKANPTKEEILNSLGEPSEKKIEDYPEGKTEIWTYDLGVSKIDYSKHLFFGIYAKHNQPCNSLFNVLFSLESKNYGKCTMYWSVLPVSKTSS